MRSLKETLESAERAIKVGDFETYNRRIAEANKMDDVSPETNLLKAELQGRSRLVQAEESILALTRFLLACQQPEEAKKLLKVRPVGLEDSPRLNALLKRVEFGLAHLDSFQLYKERYGVPIYYGGADISVSTSRGQEAVRRFEGLPDRPLKVLSIGANDARLERRLLEMKPEATIVFAEMAEGFDDVISNLEKDYPGRTTRHVMQGPFHFAPLGSQFDLVMMFEVLEHLPDSLPALKRLREYLAPCGQLLLSVPNGVTYIEDQKADDQWYQHVRAYTESTLRDELEQVFSSGPYEVGSGEETDRFAVTVVRAPDRTLLARVVRDG